MSKKASKGSDYDPLYWILRFGQDNELEVVAGSFTDEAEMARGLVATIKSEGLSGLDVYYTACYDQDGDMEFSQWDEDYFEQLVGMALAEKEDEMDQAKAAGGVVDSPECVSEPVKKKVRKKAARKTPRRGRK